MPKPRNPEEGIELCSDNCLGCSRRRWEKSHRVKRRAGDCCRRV